LRVVARCAQLLAALRGTILMWLSDHDSSVSHSVPVIEQPDRINCLLCNLARGHALLCGRRQFALEDLAPVLEVTFDSASTIRSKVFRGLLENGGTLKTAQVEKLLRCSTPTALKEMEALSVLGVADKVKVPQESGQQGFELLLADNFKWFMSAKCKSLQWNENSNTTWKSLTLSQNVPTPLKSVKKSHPVALSDAPETGETGIIDEHGVARL
jgi:hypothetical protein